ncbi:MAG: hypothetical protein HKN12_04160 [Gemmatimonadetes bacterium]|nr:hypothetical protein [Gemmatimonadota bacterium]
MPEVRRLQRVRPSSDLSVSQLTLNELQAELGRRVQNLQKQREELLAKLDEVDRELENVGLVVAAPGTDRSNGNGRAPRRRKPQNDRPLREYLIEILGDGPRTLKDVSEAVLEAGYQTTSQKFSNNVNVVLHKDEMFTKEDGMWRVVPA